MSFTQGELVNGAGSWNYNMLGRLKPGVTPAQVLQDAQPAVQEIQHNFPPGMGSLRIHPVVNPLGEATVAEARPLVRTLFLAVIVVLFISCASILPVCCWCESSAIDVKSPYVWRWARAAPPSCAGP
jgi:putative ABC transport system permease protein